MRHLSMIKYSRQSLALTAFAAAALLSACSDDDFGKDGKYYSDHICFSADKMTWGDMEDTRAVGNPTDFVLRDRNSRDTLCMKQIVTRGIHTEKNPQTRGTQVTSTAGINSFGVFAYTQQGGVEKLYMNNEQYTKNTENIFEAKTIYYWPGASLTFDFYTYSPYAATGLGLPEGTGKELEYLVPENIDDQQDLMLAVNENVPGNNNAAVPLSFTHLLTAVNVVAGTKMVNGTITSIKFTQVQNNATILMNSVASGWNFIPDSRADFQVTPNIAVTSSTAEGTSLLGEGKTFLFLPQTLNPEYTRIEVQIQEGSNTRTLTAPLSGNWAMGTTNTYRLSITPEYELKFEDAAIPDQDAHYDIFTTQLEVGDLKGKSWTVSVDCPEASVQLEKDVHDLAKQGYWVDKIINQGETETANSPSARGTSQLTSDMTGAPVLWVFLPENTTGADRTVTLNLSVDGTAVASKSVVQKSPQTVGDVNWEVIQEDKAEGPWGFNAEGNTVYVFNHVGEVGVFDGITKLFMDNLGTTLKNLVTEFNASSWATVKPYKHGWFDGTFYYVNIQYSLFDNLAGKAESNTLGFQNTTDLFGTSGSVNSNALETAIMNLRKPLGTSLMVDRRNLRKGITLPKDVPNSSSVTPTEAKALIEILKKNRFCITRSSTGTGNAQVNVDVPSIQLADIKWYMPASGQFAYMPDWTKPTIPGQTQVAGAAKSNIWSSTAVSNSSTMSYLGSGTQADRTTTHVVRAARVSN